MPIAQNPRPQADEPERFTRSYDVVVAGGGPSGMAAAWAAAVGGASTLLIERQGFLGGTGVAGKVSMYINWKARIDGQPTDLSGRFYRQLMRRLDGSGGRFDYALDDPYGDNADYVDMEDVKRHAEALLREAGVTIIYHAQADRVVLHDGRVCGLHVVGKGISEWLGTSVLVDTTGDAACCRLAGADVQYGRESDSKAQPLTMIFTVGGIDHVRLAANGKWRVSSRGFVFGNCLNAEFAAAVASGCFPGQFQPKGVSACWQHPKDKSVMSFNVTKVWGVDGSGAIALSQAEIEGRIQSEQVVQALRRHVEGFADCYLLATGIIGVRETFRLISKSTISETDVLGGIVAPDTIALCAHPMDSHLVDNFATLDWQNRIPYGIPFGNLVPKRVKGLITAGRSLSGTHLAAGSFRVIGTAMTTGEAAGHAAAMAVRTGTDVTDLDGVAVRQELIRCGALVDYRPSLAASPG